MTGLLTLISPKTDPLSLALILLYNGIYVNYYFIPLEEIGDQDR